jgi:hypothetical protein
MGASGDWFCTRREEGTIRASGASDNFCPLCTRFSPGCCDAADGASVPEAVVSIRNKAARRRKYAYRSVCSDQWPVSNSGFSVSP